MEFTVNYDLRIFQTLDELSDYFTSLLKIETDSLNLKINLALSGGSTPRYIFKHLANNHKNLIHWAKINFFWGDERCVPPTDDESNYKMAYDNLLSKVPVLEENIFRIRGEVDPEEEAKRYSDKLNKILPQKNQLPQFDLIMLGLGEDGHTASIFPDQLHLMSDNRVCAVAAHPVSKQKRITLTGKVINNAKSICFIVTGASKSKIIDDILINRTNSKEYPAGLINPLDGKVAWLLDIEVAKQLKGN
jgi:6-phosphogluconolactonase